MAERPPPREKLFDRSNLFEIAQCHNGLLRLRSTAFLDPDDSGLGGSELATLLERVLDCVLPKDARDNVMVIDPYMTYLRPEPNPSQEDITVPRSRPDRFRGESGRDLEFWRRALSDERLVDPTHQAAQTFYTVHFVDQAHDGCAARWGVIIRHSATGNTWHFSTGNHEFSELAFLRGYKELQAFLEELDVPAKPFGATYTTSPKYDATKYPASSGLHVIAHVLAFFTAGAVGWENLPVFGHKRSIMAKVLTESLHSLVGFKECSSFLDRKKHNAGCPSNCPTSIYAASVIYKWDMEKTKKVLLQQKGCSLARPRSRLSYVPMDKR
ncbi:hypothetical protein QBC34DRAFT_378475 [Podospora aff. communis PSN243]|uniref:Uncharacterized protein n=1 Tax=Podospora aff. communis PSN243 TaxID=3040156 RepID=A0AAV9GRW2_9PEZI|nr:hypothetical protein QBC34DRAFT_378475 [Podospora aff. communis PSN243]